MRIASQSMLELVNLLSVEYYGQTIEDKELQLQESKTELQESNAKIKDKELIIIRSILNLKEKMNLDAMQIASILDVDLEFVTNILTNVEG